MFFMIWTPSLDVTFLAGNEQLSSSIEDFLNKEVEEGAAYVVSTTLSNVNPWEDETVFLVETLEQVEYIIDTI